VKYSQKLDQKGFGANHDGNISVRFEDGLLATPTAVSKGDIVPEIILTLDLSGNKIDGIGKPFSEIKLHLAAYNCRPDVKAVVHAHPPFATARGLVNLPITPIIPEAIVSIGNHIPVLAFAMPGDSKNDQLLAEALSQYNVVMLPGNGVFAVGNCIEQAYLRLELVEHLAKIDYYARQMGISMGARAPMELAPENINKLLEKHLAAGLSPPTLKTETTTNVVTSGDTINSCLTINSDIIDKITKLIIDKLANNN
jgi:L-fuculose-phosphate aldolase